MSQSEIIQILKDYKKKHESEYGIQVLGIFGSAARDDFKESSDIDIVVKLKKQDLFIIIGIKQELEETLHKPVAVIRYRHNMNSFLKKRIDKEALYV